MHGWLFHVRRCPHEVQSCLIDRQVPITVVLRVHGANHLEQDARSSIKAEKNTKNFASFIVPLVEVYSFIIMPITRSIKCRFCVMIRYCTVQYTSKWCMKTYMVLCLSSSASVASLQSASLSSSAMSPHDRDKLSSPWYCGRIMLSFSSDSMH